MKKIQQKGKVSFGQAFADFFKGYFDFSGRTTRAGYWWVQLVLAIVYFVLFVIMFVEIGSQYVYHSYYRGYGASTGSPSISLFLLFLFSLFVFVPTLALSVRRMRDVGLKSKAILALYILFYALYGTVLISWYSSILSLLMNYVSNYSSPFASGSQFFVSSSPLLLFLVLAVGLFMELCTFLPTDNLATESKHPVLTAIFSNKL